MPKPRVIKNGRFWEVIFGTYPAAFAKVSGPSWKWAIEAALRSGHKNYLEAAYGEQFLLNAERVMNREGFPWAGRKAG